MRNWYSCWVLVLAALLPPTNVQADGTMLQQRCEMALEGLADLNDAQRAQAAYCYGLLQGVRELNKLYERKFPRDAYFCLGAGELSHREAAEAVIDFLKRTPKALMQNETTVAVRALRDRYPCN